MMQGVRSNDKVMFVRVAGTQQQPLPQPAMQRKDA